MAEGYLIGPGLRDAIKETITRVGEMPYSATPKPTPIRFEDIGRSSGSRLRIGKTTATWTKNTLMTIPLYENGTPPNETSSSKTLEGCVNHWGDVPANKWVGIQRGQTGSYYLVVAEC
jgi:hypothetical protein